MAKKPKKQEQQPQDESRVFMQRLQKNLEFFKKRRPEIYKLLASMELQRVELVVTPGKNDVDMVANGKSCYRGVAKEYSLDEAQRVLDENPESKKIRTFAPPRESAYRKENFAERILREIVASSPVKPDNFKGYIRGNIFPSMVFLGCGLGYHIDALTRKVPIINGIIIEREPEKFAVSLHTVDWEEICARFSRKGFSLTFAIGKADEPEEIRRLVSRYMTKDVPFYPFFSTYYNHLADVDLAKAVMENANDLAVISANWSNYDNELMRLSNTAHNVRQGGDFLPRPEGNALQSKPLVVVGSGPSLDKRIESLKKVRDHVVVVSAGTALRPLLAHGVRPDYHAELDPSYLIYQLLSDIGDDRIRDIPLLAVNEVNPFVPTLFDKVFYYFKTDNTQPSLFGLSGRSFANCNPTVTNAALSIGHALGFRNIYLFGTDYGFEDAAKDHSSKSVYGDDTDSAIAEDIQKWAQSSVKKRRVFKTPSVDGGTVLTRNDYYSAKRSVEDLIYRLKSSEAPPQIFNCADGAIIDGAPWLQESEFLRQFEETEQDSHFSAMQTFESLAEPINADSFDQAITEVHKELERVCEHHKRTLKNARLKGRRDLCTLVNDMREQLNVVRPLPGKVQVTGAQLMTHQLLKGTLQHFLYVGVCHGMACEDGPGLEDFMKCWEEGFLEFLAAVPGHFAKVMLEQRLLEEDPWAKRFIGDRDPEFISDESIASQK